MDAKNVIAVENFQFSLVAIVYSLLNVVSCDQVYTINQESRYLLVLNVPALGITKELLELFSLYGTIEE